MDYRLNRIDSEEKNRILSLHESATKKEYLVTGKKPLFEQESDSNLGKSGLRENSTLDGNFDRAKSIATQIYKASKGLGTDESGFVNAVKDIKSSEEFFKVDEFLKASDYGNKDQGFEYFISDEFGTEDADHAESIARHLKSIGIDSNYKTIGFKGREVMGFEIKTQPGKQDNQQSQQGQTGSMSLRDVTKSIQKEVGVDVDGRFGQQSINATYAEMIK